MAAPAGVRCLYPGWAARGAGIAASTRDGLILSAAAGSVRLVSETRMCDVQLRFWIRLDTAADFTVGIHQQSLDDAAADSYHLVSTRTRHYLALRHHIFASFRLSRRMWHRVVLRWVKEELELLLDDRCVAKVTDGHLPDGHSVITLASGTAEIQGLMEAAPIRN